MSRYLNPLQTVAQAGAALEREFRQRLGDDEFEKLYRTLALQASEQTSDEEAQVLGIVTLIGKTKDQTILFLSVVWLSKKEARSPLVQEMLEITRQKSLQQLLHEAQAAVERK